ncbi:MAG: alpha/beta hydrolase [Proteobacteria bacterium]|nr:alpha/beta hydrolase [Pseudomonadota bacterium]
MLNGTQDFTTEDLEYLRHGDRPLMMRLFRPKGAGPFPIVIDLHGGAWNSGDLSDCQGRDEVLVNAGLAVAALDFRQAADRYPTSLQDINYAIRWIKANAEKLKLDPKRVGLSGQSSGGHLAALAALRPDDRRYTGIALDSGLGVDGGVNGGVDARVVCVALEWPVINPLSRYHHALRSLENPATAGWVERIPEFHDTYWGDEQTMAEGNPMLALERGEDVETPPTLWLQGDPDIVHDYHDPDSGQDLNEPERFAQLYRNAGGAFEMVRVPQAERSEPRSFEPLVPFFNKHLT